MALLGMVTKSEKTPFADGANSSAKTQLAPIESAPVAQGVPLVGVAAMNWPVLLAEPLVKTSNGEAVKFR